MSGLTPADFADFVAEVHGGRQPFPWQSALVEQIIERAVWPDAIDVPTGLGKTSVIDAFVFLAAARPELARTRLFFVVDRRVVVDEAWEHACRIAKALREAKGGVLAAVAKQLCKGEQLRKGEKPLEVQRMRGGTTWSWRWLDRPDQTAVIVGTVAQVGSRLFFRGHGVSEFRRSMDAGLVGADSVIVLDEAHLAVPMLTTFRRAVQLDPAAEQRRPILVTMSATTNDTTRRGGWVHRSSDADASDSEAGRRLRASKRLRTTVVEASKAKADRAVADVMEREALALVEQGAVRVGVIVNTVARARQVYERLTRHGHIEASLLTGRMREYDRDRWYRRWHPKLKTGAERPERPVVQVATQTVEVGVNLDFDGMVTESASLDAIVQRLGRLNRLGKFDAAGPAALVVHDANVTDDDPVYLSARARTWEWLIDVCPPGAEVDAGPAALRALVDAIDAEQREAMIRPAVPVPALTAERLARFAQTSPAPEPDLPVTPFLYGFREEWPEVTVVWRAGLGDAADNWKHEVDLAPPLPGEGLELPLAVVRKWLRHQAGADQLGDGPVLAVDDTGPPEGEERRALQLTPGGGDWTVVEPSALRPNSVVVVPVQYGGVDEFGWAPASADEACDVGALVEVRGTRVVRLGPALANVLPGHKPLIDHLVADLRDEEADVPAVIKNFLDGLGAIEDDAVAELVAFLRNGKTKVRLVNGPTTAAIASGPRPTSAFAEDVSAGGSSVIGVAITLDEHQQDVAELARQFAKNIGLDKRVVNSIELAAREHDEGKRDPRFQAMLRKGDRLAVEGSTDVLAKSGMDPADRSAFRRAAELSGYPKGMRHEALSARIVEAKLRNGRDDVDPDLVVHLAASHHGRSRPLLPPIPDLDPVVIEVPGVEEVFKSNEVVDWDGPSRFERLNRAYGFWELALYEAVLRLADISRSEQPSTTEVNDG